MSSPYQRGKTMGLKEDYQRKMEAQLRQWDGKIDELKAKVDEAEADTKVKLRGELHELYAKQEAARETLRKLKTLGGGAWKELKAGIDRSWGDLKKSIDSALSKFR